MKSEWEMVKSQNKLIWSVIAADQLEEILDYIFEESPAGAIIVKEAILDRVAQLVQHPAMYEKDSLCDNNDGSFRAFTIYHYRITYLISNHEIIILRIRHTSREPEEY